MANIKASELVIDELITGAERIVSTDGPDGEYKTKNITVDSLSSFIKDKAVNELNPAIEENAKDIDDLQENVEALKNVHSDPWGVFGSKSNIGRTQTQPEEIPAEEEVPEVG